YLLPVASPGPPCFRQYWQCSRRWQAAARYRGIGVPSANKGQRRQSRSIHGQGACNQVAGLLSGFGLGLAAVAGLAAGGLGAAAAAGAAGFATALASGFADACWI